MGGNESTMKNKTTTNVANNFMQSMSTEISNRNEAELDMTQTLTFRAPFAKMKDCNLVKLILLDVFCIFKFIHRLMYFIYQFNQCNLILIE